MLVVGVNTGHDGAVSLVQDGELLVFLQSEKDSFQRHSALSTSTLLEAMAVMKTLPDVVAIGGWHRRGPAGIRQIGAGYFGSGGGSIEMKELLGHQTRVFNSTHERSHIMTAIGMAPKTDSEIQVILVWEGDIGAFYLADRLGNIVLTVPVMTEPGARYAFLYGLADPQYSGRYTMPPLQDAGKVMALAAFGDDETAERDIVSTVDRILATRSFYPTVKADFSDSCVYNAGVEAPQTKTAMALLSRRIFSQFEAVATASLPRDVPLRISGGCGLNCDWNTRWRDSGLFSSVFVPPCTDDSGSAIGSAIDAHFALTGDAHIEWNVYSGTEFVLDSDPSQGKWRRCTLDLFELAGALASGRIVAWVQGRWEIGPRALGNRSLLAEPFTLETRDRLNRVKRREAYRPIAPCCRVEDLDACFDAKFVDPYMLNFRRVTDGRLKGVTHVDGTARVQTVDEKTNPPLYRLLGRVAERSGVGVLSNTSLNVSGQGFINRLSDLITFCDRSGISEVVVGETWFRRNGEPPNAPPVG